MDDDRNIDAAETLLKGAPSWEPPDSFVLRVIAASRSDVRRDPAQPESPASLGFAAWVRAHLSGLAMKRDGTAWVMRQYLSLWRGR